MIQTIRRAHLDDAPAIRALTRGAYAKWVPLIGREPKPMGADYELAVQNHPIDLLYVDGDLLALIEMIPETDHLMIENIAVAPHAQGRGLGSRLMGHAEDVAASLGYAELRLYANKLFAENIRLYARLGYRVDLEAPFSGGVVVHMSRRPGLSPQT